MVTPGLNLKSDKSLILFVLRIVTIPLHLVCFCLLWVWFWFSLHLEIKMSESMFYLCWLVNFDSVLKYLFRSGTPRNQVVPQVSTTISPPTLRPAKNSGSSFSVASTVLVAIPVVIAVLCCFGCLAWCKLKTGWVLCLFKWIQQSHIPSIHRWGLCCSRKTGGNLVSVTQFLVGGHLSVS